MFAETATDDDDFIYIYKYLSGAESCTKVQL